MDEKIERIEVWLHTNSSPIVFENAFLYHKGFASHIMVGEAEERKVYIYPHVNIFCIKLTTKLKVR